MTGTAGRDARVVRPRSRPTVVRTGRVWPSTAARVVVAVFGGYALAAAVGACLAVLLPITRSDAVLVGTLASGLVYVASVIWVFAAASVRRALVRLILSVAVLGGGILLSRLAAGQ